MRSAIDQGESADLKALRAAVQAGLDSGPPEPLDMAAIKAEARALHAAGDRERDAFAPRSNKD